MLMNTVLALAISCLLTVPSNGIIWTIGSPDGNTEGLALAPDGYREFLNRDFGWEDKFYVVDHSKPEEDFPYVLPGPADEWGGSSYWSGLRTHVDNILFDVERKGKGDWLLCIDVIDANFNKAPVLKVSINGRPYKFQLAPGHGDGSIMGNFSDVSPAHLEIPVDENDIVLGNNEVHITTIEGSWTVFDAVYMKAPSGAALRKDKIGAYVRDVRPASWQGDFQPLLVDVLHLDGSPRLSVILDGKEILSYIVEKGEYILEAPMPTVTRKKESNYKILVDGQPVRKGKVTRMPQAPVAPSSYVDTRIGTAHSRWMLAPGPWMPFSMVKISPDNQDSGWQSGYDTSIESIGQFSHIHEWTLAGLGTMPVTGPLKTHVGGTSERYGHEDGYRSYMDKASEVSELGYYSVLLTDYDIKAELTATDRCSFQRYTYPSGVTPRVMVDLRVNDEYGYEILDCELRKTSPRRIEGWSHQLSHNIYNVEQEYQFHFVMEFDRDIVKFGGWKESELWEQECIGAQNPGLFGCYVEFAPTDDDNIVQVRTGLSFVDVEGASKNLAAEITGPFGWDFDAVHAFNRGVWDELLGRIAIHSSDALEKTRFYTNMYRSLCSRNTYNDIDGRWADQFRVIRNLNDPDARAMGCDAFWNTFWNLNQLWNLVTPEWSSRWVKSQMAMYDANGWLAKGPAGMTYIPVMVAEHEIPLMVSAYQMGIRDYGDYDHLFEALKHQQTTPGVAIGTGYSGNRDLVPYLQYHYVPCDKGAFSNTMEYSFDDWTVSQMALALGRDEDYRHFLDRGSWWKNAMNPENGYCQMKRSDGSLEPNFDEMNTGSFWQYTEANAWQMSFFVPQDVPALADFVGRDHFIEKLSRGFVVSDPVRFNAPNDSFSAYPVEHGNQQSMHFAFLFNWVGQPWETQKWSRRILERYYGYGLSNAWLGDEDQGQMSAWMVMASLGLFQTDGGCSINPHYEITSPVFEKTTIHLGGRYGRGQDFTIHANGVSRNNIYIQRAELNGKPLDTFLIDATDVLSGGNLELWMGPEPNTAWGLGKQ